MSGGLLDGLTDPALRAAIAERRIVIEKIATQFGIPLGCAAEMLRDFEQFLAPEPGEPVH